MMDRLRSPGGCPWDAEQTHSSLAPYLIEEAYETLEAIETGDLAALREELGDLLLQVLFHARLAEEAAEDERFGIDEVAGDLVAKLIRRHPHVFADSRRRYRRGVAANWEQIKQAEKQRQSVTDGVPLGQPALALAAKLVSRAGKAGLPVPPPTGPASATGCSRWSLRRSRPASIRSRRCGPARGRTEQDRVRAEEAQLDDQRPRADDDADRQADRTATGRPTSRRPCSAFWTSSARPCCSSAPA